MGLTLPNLLNILIGLTAIFLLITWFLPAYRRRTQKRPARHEIQRAYAAFENALFGATGTRRQLSQTPNEYLSSIRTHLNGLGEEAERLNAKLVSGLYSERIPTEEEIAQLRNSIKQFASHCRSGGSRK